MKLGVLVAGNSGSLCISMGSGSLCIVLVQAVIIVYYSFQKILHPQDPPTTARTPILFPTFTLENTLTSAFTNGRKDKDYCTEM